MRAGGAGPRGARARGLVIGDTGNANLRVYRNDVGQAQNLVRVRLVGKGAGAKVEHVLANYTVELREGEVDARYPYADREAPRAR